MDISPLTRLLETSGPFITLYVTTDPARENAAALFELRWKDILTELDRIGVDGATREALSAARGFYAESGTHLLIARGRGRQAHIGYDRRLPGRCDVDVVAVGPLPHLLPLLCWEQSRIPHVVALVDRRGADVLAYVDKPLPAGTDHLDATPYPWHKTRAGGWSAWRVEKSVEENWKTGAKAVADLLATAAEGVRARVLIVAGDPVALSLLREQLPADLSTRIVQVPGGRAYDGSAEHLAGHVVNVLEEQERRETARPLADFQRYRSRARAMAGTTTAQGGRPAPAPAEVSLRAADGVEATVAALQRSQVGTLLVSDAVDGSAPAWFGPAPAQVALAPEVLSALGVDVPQRATLVDVLVRACLQTGATVRCVPADRPESPTAGVGALLRYSSPT
jgi:hypothetical protein